MNLNTLSDRDLLTQTQQLVQKERELLGQILHHLKEVERRKLYSDLGYGSLFDYCLGELKYSEGQAGRRIQALKLIRELPQVEEKIESGALNLTHICQAQSFFKHMHKAASKGEIMSASKNQSINSSMGVLNKEQKLQVLHEIAHKSARETQALLLAKTAQVGLAPQLPAERERVLSEEHSEFRLIINQELRRRLEEVKSLLGPKALGMSLGELVAAMADLSLETLKDKKFGKRRSNEIGSGFPKTEADQSCPQALAKAKKEGIGSASTGKMINGHLRNSRPCPMKNSITPAKPCVKFSAKSNRPKSAVRRSETTLMPMSGEAKSMTKKPRSIAKSQRWQVWQRDKGACGKCGSQLNLQLDHRVPVAWGGTGELENLRLLCGNCNLREGIKSFGAAKMRRVRAGRAKAKKVSAESFMGNPGAPKESKKLRGAGHLYAIETSCLE